MADIVLSEAFRQVFFYTCLTANLSAFWVFLFLAGLVAHQHVGAFLHYWKLNVEHRLSLDERRNRAISEISETMSETASVVEQRENRAP